MTTPHDEQHPDRVATAARWFYGGVWRVLIEWFRVPAEPPTLPVEAGEASEAFRPDSGLLDYFRLWYWLVAILAALGITVLWILVTSVVPWLGVILLPVTLLLILVPGIITYVGIHLRFDTTWYVMTKRSLRIRRGIWLIHEMTITFENVQNVKAEQGPIQRFFGIGNLVIETAGGGGGGDQGKKGFAIANRAVIEGIADVTHRRDQVLARLQSSRETGLGDETPRPREAWTPAHLTTLREIREAAGILRRGA